jgi:hypothetical protein
VSLVANELLKRSCVRIKGDSSGTGFFVFPGHVITCAHVVGYQSSTGIIVEWQGKCDSNAQILQIYPDPSQDLALLRVHFTNHPFVQLGHSEAIDLGKELVAYGFPKISPQRYQGEFLTAYYEGSATLLDNAINYCKFKDANVIPGFSGAPLCHRSSQQVIGIISETRGTDKGLGGYAVPTEFMFSAFPDLKTENEKCGDISLPLESAHSPESSYDFSNIKSYLQDSKLLVSRLPPLKNVLKLYREDISDKEKEDIVHAYARRWLWPGDKGESNRLDFFRQIKKVASLSDAEFSDFLGQITQICQELSDEHTKLAIWISRRIALLEFLHTDPSPETLPLKLEMPQSSIDQNLLMFQIRRTKNQKEKLRQTQDLVRQALTAAGQIVSRILGKETCDFWSNLMLLLAPSASALDLFAHETAQNNLLQADQIWKGCAETQERLYVVAESNEPQESEYLGFWLPIYKNMENPPLGAATAYLKAVGSAVFRDDLPLAPMRAVIPDEVVARWQIYMTQKFRHNIFVSLPLYRSRANNKVLAVLNVNIRPKNLKDFRRAYHPEWLEIATYMAMPHICEAYKAFMILQG